MQENLPPKNLRERIEEKILNGEKIKEIYDLDSPLDQYIFERLTYYRFVIPLMTELKTNIISEDSYNNCLIQMYLELREQGRLYIHPDKRIK